MQIPLLPAATAGLAALAFAGLAQAQGLPELETEFADGSTLRFYGQVNMGVLSYRDGVETETYGLVDNDTSSTRFGLVHENDVADGWTIETRFEAEYQPYSTSNVSILNQDRGDWGFDRDNIRKIDLSLESDRFGTFRLGQGSMASDGSAEADLSGTGAVAESSVEDSAGGQLFRFAEAERDPSDIAVGDAFSNYDGLGRKVRLRYDTPKARGFGLRFSYGQDRLQRESDSLYDVAATYEGEAGPLEMEGVLAYARTDADDDILSGSFSALHDPTGLSMTLAAGRKDGDGATGRYGYAKLGLERDFFAFGSTAFSVDYYAGSDIAAEASDSESYALAAVQNVAHYGTELWLTVRRYAYDDAAAYEDGRAIFGGARFRF